MYANREWGEFMPDLQTENAIANKSNHSCDVMLIGYENQENLGLRSIAAFLDQNGVRVKLQPCHDTAKESILLRTQREQPKLIGFSLIFQRMLYDFANLISYLRQNGVKAHFTIGGHFPTFQYEEILKTIPGLDSVVRHEGEYTLLELFRNLDRPGFWAQINGIAYRQGREIIEEGNDNSCQNERLVHFSHSSPL